MEINSGTFRITEKPFVHLGTGMISQVGEICLEYGKKVLLVTGGRSYEHPGISGPLEASLEKAKIKWERYPVSGEPSPAIVDRAVATYRNKGIEVVLAVGGGSVMDAGKAMAAMFHEEKGIRHYLEGVGDRKPGGRRSPLIAVPTTAGTGSEATKNAVISEFGPDGFKKSLRHDNYIPDVALLDPKLTLGCSPEQTAASGMDAFTQLLEAYLSNKATAFTDSLALNGLTAVSVSLKKVMQEPDDLVARSGMSYAAFLSGICLAHAGLGLSHGFAQPLGSLYPIPHGVVCGTLMGVVNRATVKKLREGDASVSLTKYARVGELFSDRKNAGADYYIDHLLDTIDEWVEAFHIPDLSGYGIKEEDIPKILALTGLKNHPVELNEKEIETLLRERL